MWGLKTVSTLLLTLYYSSVACSHSLIGDRRLGDLERTTGTAAPTRKLKIVFQENGRWDKGPPVLLSDKDRLHFRDACKERTWSSNKLVVVSGTRHSSSWLGALATEPLGLDHILYQNADPQKPNYFEPYGNEAGAYLTFIYQFYNCLPQYVAFIHGHKQESWHSLDMSETLYKLQWSKIPGYTDINRKGGHKYITLDHQGRHPFTDMKPIALGRDVYNGSFSKYQIIEGKVYDYMIHPYLDEVAFARAYDHFFGPQGFGPMPEKVLHYCCGQFAATREAIQGRSRQFYQDAILYMRPENNDLTGHHHTNRQYVMGDVFTVFYAMIMGKPAIYHKEVSDCLLFGDCAKGDIAAASEARR